MQVVNAADRVSRRGQGLVQAIQLQRASADQAKELGAPLAGPIAGDFDDDLVQQRVGGLEAGFEAALLEKNVGADDALGERSRGRGHWRALRGRREEIGQQRAPIKPAAVHAQQAFHDCAFRKVFGRPCYLARRVPSEVLLRTIDGQLSVRTSKRTHGLDQMPGHLTMGEPMFGRNDDPLLAEHRHGLQRGI